VGPGRSDGTLGSPQGRWEEVAGQSFSNKSGTKAGQTGRSPISIRRKTEERSVCPRISAARPGAPGERIVFLSENPGAGHRRRDLTDYDVRFFPVYSYLVVYRPDTKPVQVVSILHGRRDVEGVLKRRPS